MYNGSGALSEKEKEEIGLHAAETDLFNILRTAIPQHEAYFRPVFQGFYGLALFIKRTIPVREEGEIFVYKEQGFVPGNHLGEHARNIQYTTFKTPAGERTVINFHGLWKQGRGKTDNADRIIQSENIVRFLKTLKNQYVLCGDFNLMPDTQSIKVIENAGLRNLITEYSISSTRTPLYPKSEPYADYAFVSEGIKVKDFRVLLDVISDHKPLYLEFD